MSKIMTIPRTKESIYELENVSDAFVLGIKDLSVNMPIYFSIDEIKEIVSNLHNKEIFITLNKNMHNNDIDYAKEIMIELNKLDITGVFYYDIGIVNLYNNLKLNYSLVWAQEHLTTNYYTCNFWNHYGADYALLSSEITLDEIHEIRNNTDVKLIVPIFGYLSMFVSKRHLVQNYLNYFSLSGESSVAYMEKEGNIYPIVDDNNGTNVYSARILNGLEESLDLSKQGLDYLLLNGFNIEGEKFKEIVSIFKNLNDNNVSESARKIDELIDKPIDKGFLYKETVYRVKNNE